MENPSTWQLVNPGGIVKSEQFEVSPRPQSLDNKLILLRWNGKHNGNIFLNRIAELLMEKATGTRIIKGWEVAPETVGDSYGLNKSKELAQRLAEFKPDIVIGAQAD